MNKTTVKALRKIINPSSSVSKKVFRRLKKAYNALNEAGKTALLKQAKQSSTGQTLQHKGLG